jgi:Holliday junction resolvase RusA-like endonuclease
MAMRSPDGSTRHLAQVYNPASAKAWKRAVAEAGRFMRPHAPLAGPLRVSLTFRLKRPKRLLRKKDPDGPVLHTAKPDGDNLAKGVLDALTVDGWWTDDSTVSELVVRKEYHAKGEEPGALVTVEEMEAK